MISEQLAISLAYAHHTCVYSTCHYSIYLTESIINPNEKGVSVHTYFHSVVPQTQCLHAILLYCDYHSMCAQVLSNSAFHTFHTCIIIHHTLFVMLALTFQNYSHFPIKTTQCKYVFQAINYVYSITQQ